MVRETGQWKCRRGVLGILFLLLDSPDVIYLIHSILLSLVPISSSFSVQHHVLVTTHTRTRQTKFLIISHSCNSCLTGPIIAKYHFTMNLFKNAIKTIVAQQLNRDFAKFTIFLGRPRPRPVPRPAARLPLAARLGRPRFPLPLPVFLSPSISFRSKP